MRSFVVSPLAVSVGLIFLLHVCSALPKEPKQSNQVGTDKDEKDDFSSKEREKFSLESWESPPEIAKAYPYYLSGYDSEDRGIIVLELGKWDVRSMAKKGGQGWIDLQRHAEKMLYHLKNGAHRKNVTETVGNSTAIVKSSEDIVLIVDWDEFKLIQMFSPEAVGFVVKYMGKLERFQEKIAYGFFVNVNRIANAAVNALRPVLGRFMERVEIYGTQTSSWIPVVRRHLPEDQISPKYGGLPGFTPVKYHG